MGLGFVIDHAWISQFLRQWRSIYMTAQRAFMLVKKVTYFGESGYRWTIHVLEKVSFWCFWVPQEIHLRVLKELRRGETVWKI